MRSEMAKLTALGFRISNKTSSFLARRTGAPVNGLAARMYPKESPVFLLARTTAHATDVLVQIVANHCLRDGLHDHGIGRRRGWDRRWVACISQLLKLRLASSGRRRRATQCRQSGGSNKRKRAD